MGELVGSVTIRNKRLVYRERGSFVVAHIDSKGVQHRYSIPEPAIDRLYALTKGETISKDEAASRIQDFAEELLLTYQYGWKLDFLALEMLVVLVALGNATLAREGRKYHFSIH